MAEQVAEKNRWKKEHGATVARFISKGRDFKAG